MSGTMVVSMNDSLAFPQRVNERMRFKSIVIWPLADFTSSAGWQGDRSMPSLFLSINCNMFATENYKMILYLHLVTIWGCYGCTILTRIVNIKWYLV